MFIAYICIITFCLVYSAPIGMACTATEISLPKPEKIDTTLDAKARCSKLVPGFLFNTQIVGYERILHPDRPRNHSYPAPTHMYSPTIDPAYLKR